MSRTFIVDQAQVSTALFTSNQHEQLTAVERAMREGNVVNSDGALVSSFHFDMVEFIRAIQVKRLKDDVISRLMYSVDAYINGGLSRMLNELYQFSKDGGNENFTFPTYSDFLACIEGIETREDAIYEAGCDVSQSIERVRTLFGLRDELHYLKSLELVDPTKHVVPDIRDMLLNPRVRTLTAADEEGLRQICEDDTDDKELQHELLEQYKLQSKLESMNQHKLDRMKGQALVTLLNCLNIRESTVTDESDSFGDLDKRTQFNMLNTVMRAITETRRKAVTDNRLPIMEKAALRVEAKALIAQLTVSLNHTAFADLA